MAKIAETPETKKEAAIAKTPAAAPRDAAKDSALQRAVQQIEKQYGKGAVMRLDLSRSATLDGIPTGSLSLDIALGGGGIPRGRVIEIFGPESSGKTTLTLHIIASAQKMGGVAAFIDAEHALDPSWAKRLGVKLEDLLVSQPDTGEQGLEICELLVRSNAVDVIVIDSVAALIPRAEIEGDMGDSHMGLQARLMSQACRPMWLSPMSPSISARGISAATESMTMTSTALDRTSSSQISSPCSPVSGCETSRSSSFTPSRLAHEGSSACSASMNAANAASQGIARAL